jgi:hypothetical protein
VLDPRVIAARAAPGQADVASRLSSLLAGGTLDVATARRVQDPLSFRVVAPVHGAGAWMLGEAIRIVEIELNSAADSPLVAADGALLSNGNFQMPALAVALDALAIALTQMASLAAGRIQRFMSPGLTDLPLQLTRHGPAHSGFATLQKTTVALLADIRHRANPASLDFLPVLGRRRGPRDDDRSPASRSSPKALAARALPDRDRAHRRRPGDRPARAAARRPRPRTRAPFIRPSARASRCSTRTVPLGPDVERCAHARLPPDDRRRDRVTWLARNWDQVALGLAQHVGISISALAIAFALSLPLGIWAARSDRVQAVALTVAGFLYTIPTLAFLALLIPLVGLGPAERDHRDGSPSRSSC